MSEAQTGLLSHIGFRSAAALVVANVIGAGVFATTGFQVAGLGRPGLILLLGIVASAIILSGSVDQILFYAGFTLALMSALATAVAQVPDNGRLIRRLK